MQAFVERSSAIESLIPEPCLINPSKPMNQPSVFTVQKTLFGNYDLQYSQFVKNKKKKMTISQSHPLNEAAILLIKKVEEKINDGYFMVSLNESLWTAKFREAKNCIIYDINPKNKIDDKEVLVSVRKLYCKNQSNMIRIDTLRDILSEIIKNSHKNEDSAESNVVNIATPIQWPWLDKTLRSVFMKDKKILEVVFKMEDAGIIFIGDFVQLKKEQISLYTKNLGITEKMVTYLKERSLSMNTVVKRWHRPSTFGIMM